MNESNNSEQKSRFDFSRTSFQSNCLEELDDEDPISVYFKQRLLKTKKNVNKVRESDCNSSVSVIDVDNISLLDDNERDSIENRKLYSLNPFEAEKVKTVVKAGLNEPDEDNFIFKRPPTPEVPKSELNLIKQRNLAQKALARLAEKSFKNHSKDTTTDINESGISLTTSLKCSPPSEVNRTSDVENAKSRNWFELNQSPQTPKYFIDELSSMTPDDPSLQKSKLQSKSLHGKPSFGVDSKKEFLKNISDLRNTFSRLDTGSEVFQTKNAEDALHRFEEDEKKFIAEQSVLSHNSEISQFSGVVGEDVSSWSPSNLQKENKKVSIGEFFGLRSNSISSLMGPVSEGDYSSNSTNFGGDLPSSTLCRDSFDCRTERVLSSASHKDETLDTKKRCQSTYSMKKSSEPTFVRRHSNESCESNSTISIQNILAGMETGLSGTQIYEQLIKSSAKKKQDCTKENNDVTSDTADENLDGSLKIFRKLSHCHKSTPISRRGKPMSDYSDHSVSVVSEDFRPTRDQHVLSLKNEKVKNKPGFNSSTPKNETSKGRKKTHLLNQLAQEGSSWQPLRVSCVRPNFNKTETIADNDGTLVQSRNSDSSGSSTHKQDNILGGTITIEDTVMEGDLTILSQRIDEMKEESEEGNTSNRPEPTLLKVVQELANLPIGSVDCSALTPLLRNQYPELLSIPLKNIDFSNSSFKYSKGVSSMQDVMSTEPGSWIKLCSKRGYNDKIYACAEVKKTVCVPLTNLTKQWILVTFQSVDIKHHNGRLLNGVKGNDEWLIGDFLAVSFKDALVPPESQLQLKVSILPRVPTILDIKIKLLLKDLLSGNTQTSELCIRVNGVNPVSGINIVPKGPINFGVIPEQCYDERTVTLTCTGICDLPLQIFIKEADYQSQQFVLGRRITVNGKPVDEEWQDEKLLCNLEEGRKHVLEFNVLFQPRTLPEGQTKIDLQALLVIRIAVCGGVNGTLAQVPMTGTVGFSKFLCDPSCSPLVFQVPAVGHSITRPFPLKNVGAIPLEFSVQIICDDSKQEQSDGLFLAPKSVYLPKNDETVMNITFTGNTKEAQTKRLLTMQMKPNGQVLYDVELIGIVKSSLQVKSTSSRCTSPTGSATTSVYSTDSIPIKLLTTTHSVSWPCVPIEKEMKQTVQIKNASSVKTTARITFKHDTNVFKILNDDGEQILKFKKTLKPDIPVTLTIVFRPDAIGVHQNAIYIETNSASKQKMVSLNGYGGSPNLSIGNTKSDLNGQKMIKLHNPSAENHRFSNYLEFSNHGKVPGFVWIKPNMKDLSLTKWMTVKPSKFVVHPSDKVTVEVSQKLKNDDIKILLSGKDIGKIATLSIVTGDEPSRLRLRRLVERKGISTEDVQTVVENFENEVDIDVRMCDDEAAFEDVFLKSLKIEEIAVVVKRFSSFDEPTLLEEDETCKNFVTICNAFDSIMSTVESDNIPHHTGPQSNAKITPSDSYVSSSSSRSGATLRQTKKIAKWLESIEDPTNRT